MEIKNQTAIVTGAASGMGAETARCLAAAGANVALFDQNIKAAQTVAKSINALAVSCDVTSASSVESALQTVIDQYGPPRICINCAGILHAKRIVGREGVMPLEDFEHVIKVNLLGTFNVLRVVAAELTQQKPINEDNERGVIINTASIAAYEGQIGQAAYSASKGGVAALTLPAAREFAQFGIRVVTIAPGLIDTPMLANLPEKAREPLQAGTPFPKRFGKPNEYAKLALHIIENTFINGEVIRLDAALRMV